MTGQSSQVHLRGLPSARNDDGKPLRKRLLIRCALAAACATAVSGTALAHLGGVQGPVGMPPMTGPLVQVTISDRRTLDAGGILPLALGIPALLALTTATLRI